MSHDNNANPERPTPPPSETILTDAKPSAGIVDGARARLGQTGEQISKGLHEVIAHPRETVKAAAETVNQVGSDARRAVNALVVHPVASAKFVVGAATNMPPEAVEVASNQAKKVAVYGIVGGAVAAQAVIGVGEGQSAQRQVDNAVQVNHAHGDVVASPVNPTWEETIGEVVSNIEEDVESAKDQIEKGPYAE